MHLAHNKDRLLELKEHASTRCVNQDGAEFFDKNAESGITPQGRRQGNYALQVTNKSQTFLVVAQKRAIPTVQCGKA